MKLPLASSANLGRRATAEDFGTGVGERAIGDALNSASLITERLYETEATMQAEAAASRATSEINDLVLELEDRAKHPDHHQHAETFAERTQEILERNSGSLSFPGISADFDGHMGPMVEQYRVKVNQHVRKRTVDKLRGDGLYAHKIQVNLAGEALTGDDQNRHMANAERIRRELLDAGGIDYVESQTLRFEAETQFDNDNREVGIQKFADGLDLDKPESEALAAARVKYDGEWETKAVDEIKRRYVEKRNAEARDLQKRYDDLTERALKKNEQTGMSSLTVQDLDKEDGLPAAMRVNLHKNIAAMNKEGGIVTDQEFLRELRSALTQDSTRGWAMENFGDMGEYGRKLDADDRKFIQGLIDNVPSLQRSMFEKRLTQSLGILKVTGPEVDDAMRKVNNARLIAFQRRMNTAYNLMEREGVVDIGEIEKLFSQGLLMQETAVDNWGPDAYDASKATAHPRFAIMPQDIDIDDYSRDEWEQAKEAAGGEGASEEAIKLAIAEMFGTIISEDGEYEFAHDFQGQKGRGSDPRGFPFETRKVPKSMRTPFGGTPALLKQLRQRPRKP